VKFQRRLDAGSDLELLHDIRHVMLYGSVSAIEASRDLVVGSVNSAWEHALADLRQPTFPIGSRDAASLVDDAVSSIELQMR
jgi:hypothetical protein